jgi:hypothetical protein
MPSHGRVSKSRLFNRRPNLWRLVILLTRCHSQLRRSERGRSSVRGSINLSLGRSARVPGSAEPQRGAKFIVTPRTVIQPSQVGAAQPATDPAMPPRWGLLNRFLLGAPAIHMSLSRSLSARPQVLSKPRPVNRGCGAPFGSPREHRQNATNDRPEAIPVNRQ